MSSIFWQLGATEETKGAKSMESSGEKALFLIQCDSRKQGMQEN